MKRTVLWMAAVGAAVSMNASGAQTQGVDVRYRLDEGQVVVYRAVVDIKAQGTQETNAPLRSRTEQRLESETHAEIVFSYTAGKRLPIGDTELKIEILDIALTRATKSDEGRERVEMNTERVKIYEGSKLVRDASWDDIELNRPLSIRQGLNLQKVLVFWEDTSINEQGRISTMVSNETLRTHAGYASFLQLLRCQPVLPTKPMAKDSSWEAWDHQAIVDEPVSLTSAEHMRGAWKLRATEAVTHIGRRCASLSMTGEWSRTENREEREVTASGTGKAIVDLATGVMFAYSTTIKQRTREGAAGYEARSETTATVTYIGGKEVYDQYKAKRAPKG